MKKKAFTIVELLIAMIIFGIWIVVIMSVLNHNVVLSKTLSLKTKATMFAKEWMELVYNIRDQNNLQYRQRDCYSWCTNYDENWKFLWSVRNSWENYKVWLAPKSYLPFAEKLSDSDDAQIYFQNKEFTRDIWTVYSWFFYDYDSENWKKTPFRRYVNFESVKWLDASATWKILKLNSISSYQFWWLTWKIELNSFISDWK